MRSILFLRVGLLVGLSTLAVSYASAEVPLRGFGQVGLQNTDTDTGSVKSNTNNFYNGALDLFMATNISKKASFLAEIGYEMTAANQTGIDVERLTVQYIFSPWLKVGAGRFHTALGYWNDNYHHGSWLHVTTDRPLIYHFEDDSGVLPTHSEGLEIRGEGDMGPGQLGYIFNVANGRNAQVDPPQVSNDKNRDKAANLLLFYTLPNLGNLRFGGVYYTDTLPGCTYDSTITNPALIDNCSYTAGASALRAKGKEKIYGAHVAWAPDNFETIMEYFVLDHTYDSANTSPTANVDATINGGYLQLSYKIEDWTPYYRYDLVNVPDSKTDAYTNREGSTSGHTVGARWDFDLTSALKFEYYGEEIKHADPAVATEKSTKVSVNWSFTF